MHIYIKSLASHINKEKHKALSFCMAIKHSIELYSLMNKNQCIFGHEFLLLLFHLLRWYNIIILYFIVVIFSFILFSWSDVFFFACYFQLFFLIAGLSFSCLGTSYYKIVNNNFYSFFATFRFVTLISIHIVKSLSSHKCRLANNNNCMVRTYHTNNFSLSLFLSSR